MDIYFTVTTIECTGGGCRGNGGGKLRLQICWRLWQWWVQRLWLSDEYSYARVDGEYRGGDSGYTGRNDI